MATSKKSLGFSIPKKQDEYLEERLGYDIIDVIRALLAETMQDEKLQNKVAVRLESFNASRILKEDDLDDMVFY